MPRPRSARPLATPAQAARPRPARTAASRAGRVLVALLCGTSLVLAACSDPPPDPVEERRQLVRARLESFTDAQADCILDRLDDTTLRALDRSADLDPGGEAMVAYSEAVAACVDDPDPDPDPDPES